MNKGGKDSEVGREEGGEGGRKRVRLRPSKG